MPPVEADSSSVMASLIMLIVLSSERRRFEGEDIVVPKDDERECRCAPGGLNAVFCPERFARPPAC